MYLLIKKEHIMKKMILGIITLGTLFTQPAYPTNSIVKLQNGLTTDEINDIKTNLAKTKQAKKDFERMGLTSSSNEMTFLQKQIKITEMFLNKAQKKQDSIYDRAILIELSLAKLSQVTTPEFLRDMEFASELTGKPFDKEEFKKKIDEAIKEVTDALASVPSINADQGTKILEEYEELLSKFFGDKISPLINKITLKTATSADVRALVEELKKAELGILSKAAQAIERNLRKRKNTDQRTEL